jgi:hypothetical protein
VSGRFAQNFRPPLQVWAGARRAEGAGRVLRYPQRTLVDEKPPSTRAPESGA